jgi:membrane-associated progesterone receptor component
MFTSYFIHSLVGLEGTVFDVSAKADVYGKGRSYNIFAGKDASKGLGMSSLKPEHAVSDYSELNETDMKVLNDWHGFFSYVFSRSFTIPVLVLMQRNHAHYVCVSCRKRYNIVGRVVDLPPPASL